MTKFERAKEEAIQTALNTSKSIELSSARAGFRHGLENEDIPRLVEEVRNATSFEASPELDQIINGPFRN